MDKTRPVLILTRALARPEMNKVVVAEITSTIRGTSSEVAVGPSNGLDQSSVVSCDNISTIRVASLGRLVGYLRDDQEAELARAMIDAFDLEHEELP
ncbi:MAG: type II toxin-antitoxin system PemK/MazF family toxin [Marmoricola sp.]